MIDWRKSGGPAVTSPSRQGQGTRFIERRIAYELGREASISFNPDGLHTILSFPSVTSVMPKTSPDVAKGSVSRTDKTSPAFAGMRILVVEDDYMVAQLVTLMLEGLGCVVIGPFPDAASGVATVRNNIIDGAVLDANLGGGMTSAPDAAALLAASLPFVVATGYRALALSDEAFDPAPRNQAVSRGGA